VAKVGEPLAVNKQISHSYHMERLNLKKLHKAEGKQQYHVQVSNRFADMDTKEEINSAWEMIAENIKIPAKQSIGNLELKKHEPRFDEGCSKFVDQRKQAKLQWLQDPRNKWG
jgi:hypothetical protein